MPKRKFELVSIPEEPFDEGQLEWNSCFLCQKATNEKLILPENSKCKDKGTGYKRLAEDLKRLTDISSLPFPVGLGLHERAFEDVLSLLVTNEAKLHKSCKKNVTNNTMKGPSCKRILKCLHKQLKVSEQGHPTSHHIF